MAILVVGSVAFDSLETPSGKRERVLGGAATHFALAASFFTDVRVIGVVGEDFLPEHEAVMTRRGIDTRGIERAPGLSFHWTGSYLKDLNAAETLATDLNVFAEFEPKIPEPYLDSEYLFLANIDPVLQARVRREMPGVKMVAGDTMNYWIAAHRENLLKVLAELDVLLINDGEARMLSGEANALRAAQMVMALGPKSLVVKHGEYGATVYTSGGKTVSCAGLAARRCRRPDRCGRFVCRRLLWIHCIAGRCDARSAAVGDVLRQRDGVVCVRAVWHGTVAGSDARGDR